jgi:hypothetical protein
MSMRTEATELLNRMLEPVTRCLTPEAARHLIELRADPDAQARMDELAERGNEGQLGPEEQAEYEAYVSAANLIAVLQSKARAFLTGHAA